ncbi:MAG: hypothetical protein NXI32_18060 [bacterium]|nr:hypothetical protein [bacterium]
MINRSIVREMGKAVDTRTVLRMGVRGLTICCRFLLPIYIAESMSMSELGLYGIIAGIAGMMPALAGWGLNFAMSRQIIRANDQNRGGLIRDRLSVSILTVCLLAAIAVPILIVFAKLPTDLVLLATILAALEVLAVDVEKCLLAINEPEWSIWLMFLRYGAWVLPCILIGATFESMRSLQFVFELWIFMSIAALALGLWRLKRIPFQANEWHWGGSFDGPLVLSCFPVYLYDVSLAGLLYAERYVVAASLGLEATGVFTFCWSVCNAMVGLVSSSFIQPANFLLVELSQKNRLKWRLKLEQLLKQVAATSAVLSLLGAIGFLCLMQVWPKLQIPGAFAVICAMLLGACFRIISDTCGVAMYSLDRDRLLLISNLAGFALLCVLSYIGATFFGLFGAALANALVFMTLAMFRYFSLPTG